MFFILTIIETFNKIDKEQRAKIEAETKKHVLRKIEVISNINTKDNILDLY